VGCSFTQGWAISDDETFAWKLQHGHPEVEFRNFGTAGYGTYQSLLVLERIFQGPVVDRPSMVIYGMISHHESRNVASNEWSWFLHVFNSMDIDPPFCTLDASGTLLRHPPKCPWFHIPLKRSLRTARVVENAINRWRLRPSLLSAAYRRGVTEKLLLEMNDLCRSYATDFVVAVLDMDDATRTHYSTFCRTNHIDFVNCIHPITPEWKVVGDGHPNGAMNTLWADDVNQALGSRFISLSHPSQPEKTPRVPNTAGK
jgi:hypothetical protein